MTTVAVWPSRQNAFAASLLLGKPVWLRTVEAAGALRPRRVVWVGTKAPEGFDTISTADIGSRRDTIVFLADDLPCLSPRGLKRIVAASRLRPSALFHSDGGPPVVIAADAARVKEARARSFQELAKRLRPDPVFGDAADLHAVDSARAWSEAHQILRLRKIDTLMRRGALLPDPSSVCVDPEVVVSKGALISPWVRLEGETRIGADCVIGSFSHLIDATIGAGTRILDHCFIRESRIGRKASVGPFSHLRPAADVGDRARVGNFVELKKTTLGAGAKVSHLAYVGDAKIGRGANLGAGTITCNYDGKTKSRTVVGDGAFIGSDVQLVAPVRVGKGAYVAAGSCIVDDVPAHALALARSRQIVKKGWAKK